MVHWLWPCSQAVILTNQLAHSFPDLLYPFTILQSLGQAILWPGLSFGTVSSDVTSQEFGLNEVAVWKEPTPLFPLSAEVTAGHCSQKGRLKREGGLEEEG